MDFLEVEREFVSTPSQPVRFLLSVSYHRSNGILVIWIIANTQHGGKTPTTTTTVLKGSIYCDNAIVNARLEVGIRC